MFFFCFALALLLFIKCVPPYFYPLIIIFIHYPLIAYFLIWYFLQAALFPFDFVSGISAVFAGTPAIFAERLAMFAGRLAVNAGRLAMFADNLTAVEKEEGNKFQVLLGVWTLLRCPMGL